MKRALGPVVIGGQSMPWGKGVVANGFVFLSGLEGRTDDDGRPVAGIENQTTIALERGRQYLAEAGASPDGIVRLVQYLANSDDVAGYHAARDAWMREHAAHLLSEQSYAGILLVQSFTRPDRLVEIEMTAVVDEATG